MAQRRKKQEKKIKTARELAVEARARGERDKVGSIAKVKEEPTETKVNKPPPGGLGGLAAAEKKKREERRKAEEAKKKKQGLRGGGRIMKRRRR